MSNITIFKTIKVNYLTIYPTGHDSLIFCVGAVAVYRVFAGPSPWFITGVAMLSDDKSLKMSMLIQKLPYLIYELR